MTDASDVRWLQDQYDWEAHQTPENDPPINEYDARYDAWIFNESIGENE